MPAFHLQEFLLPAAWNVLAEKSACQQLKKKLQKALAFARLVVI